LAIDFKTQFTIRRRSSINFVYRQLKANAWADGPSLRGGQAQKDKNKKFHIHPS
jgi:hypothetical protein